MKKLLLATALGLSAAFGASAQYYELANQTMQMLQPALSGASNYKGFVEAEYLFGVGNSRANFLNFTTTQGFQFNSWFFMGVGAGVDVIFAQKSNTWGNWGSGGGFDINHASSQTGVMIPLYSDFRFSLGNRASTSAFIDLRLGASFLVSDQYLQINNGYLYNNECFYLRPSFGVRIPTNKSNQRQAVDIGISYQLITGNYWYNYSNSVTLSSLGVNLGYEW